MPITRNPTGQQYDDRDLTSSLKQQLHIDDRPVSNGLSHSVLDLQSIRKLLKNNDTSSNECPTNDGITCPSCQMPFDKGKKRKLTDTCGHERCYSCMFTNEQCPNCSSQQIPEIRKSSLNVHDPSTTSPTSCATSNNSRNLTKSRFSSVSQLLQINRKDQRPSSQQEVNSNKSLDALKQNDDVIRVCATPPQHRRRLFNPKSLRSPFGHRRTGSSSNYTGFDFLRRPAHQNNSALSDDESAKSFHAEGRKRDLDSRLRMGGGWDKSETRDSAQVVDKMKQPVPSYSSLASTNTSPVSTLTGSSDADMSRVLQDSGIYITGSNSIGSLMSMSISEKSTASLSPQNARRHSLTASHSNEDGSPFKKLIPARRSARTTGMKPAIDPKIRAAHLRQGPQLMLKPLFFEVPVREQEPLFVGRQWLLRDISNTLNQSESQGVLIQGSPGTGKTAILLQLVEYSCFGRRRNIHQVENDGIYCQINVVNDRIKALSSYVVAYHFCQADNNATCLVPDFIHSLAAQLCQAPQLSTYRDYLLGESYLQNVLSVKECIADPERALKMGILEPLMALKKTGNIATKTCVILIDGLCEAEYHRPDQGDTISSFLARMIPYFPPWLKIIATVRTQILELVKNIQLTRFSLDSNTEVVQKDLYEYCTYRIKSNPLIQKNIQVPGETPSSIHMKFVQYSMTLARGSFLYMKLILDLIENGHLIIKSNTFKVLPVSLAQVLLLKFNLKFPTETKFEKISNILNVCLASLYPLNQAEIYYSTNALVTQNPMQWQEFIEIFNEVSDLIVKRSDNTYMFFHPSLREWLIRRDAGESTKFLCDSRKGHAAIAFRLSRLHAPLDSDQILEMGHHILKAHIYRAGNTPILSRDLQSFWIASVASCIQSSLSTLRNVYSPNIKVSRLLLLAGASPDYITEFLGNAPILCIAASEGITPMINLLLEFGADVEKSNSQGCTPLILAAAKGHYDVVRQLVASGSSLGHTDTSKRCALVHASRSGKLNVLKYLLACDWIPRNDSDDVTLEEAAQQSLIVSACQGYSEIVEELLEIAEVGIDVQDSINGDTALIAAAKHGCLDTMTLLLSRSANFSARNKKNMTPLMVATKEGHLSIVERLLQHNVDLEERDEEGKTALIYASQENHTEIMECLLNWGANLEMTDNEGLTALSWSCLRGHLIATTLLIDKAADLNHIDKSGRTPLDLAAYQGSAALAQLLLEKGSKIEHMDLKGMRPLDRAIACRNVNIVQVFLKKGAKLGPATWEMAFGKPEILLLLLNKLLEDGNTLYKKNRLQDASYRYQYALKKFPNTQNEHTATFTQLKINFLLNHCRCNRKMNNIAESIDLASEAIELNPEHYEGYHLRAKAYMEQCDFDQALRDSKTALQLSQTTASAEIKSILIRYHDEVSNHVKTALFRRDHTTEL